MITKAIHHTGSSTHNQRHRVGQRAIAQEGRRAPQPQIQAADACGPTREGSTMIGRIRRLAGAAAVVVALLGVSTTNMHAAQASVAAPAASTEEHQSTATSHGAVTPPSASPATSK